MTRMALAALTALGLLGSWAGPARAQFTYQRPATSPYSQPAVSPYLNMTRSGNPAVNYNTLVRPQIDNARAFQQLQTQVQQNEIKMGQLSAAPNGIDPNAVLPFTGHQVQFMTYSHYYTMTARQGTTPLGGRR
jgi:hypothetical protein